MRRTKGKYKQRSRFGCSKTRLIASKDISKECGEGKLYTQNYIQIEYLVLASTWFDFKYYPI